MSNLFITEYHTPTSMEPGKPGSVRIGLAVNDMKFGAGTKIVRVIAEEPCKIGFDTDDPQIYLPADKPEKFNVERVKTISVKAAQL